MRPGVTSQSEIQGLLNKLPLPLSWTGSTDSGYQWFERSDNTLNHYTATAYAKDGRLTQISLNGPFNLALKQVFQQLGEPKQYSFTSVSSDVTGTAHLSVRLYYPETGIIFSINYFDQANGNEKFKLCMTDQDLISDITIVKPASIEGVLYSFLAPFTYRNLTIEQQVQDIAKHLKSWSGYVCSQIDYRN